MPSEDLETILVIDDDDAIRGMLSDMLDLLGFRVVACASGSQGLHTARLLRPSLITLDLQMPEMDGLDVLSKLGSDAATAEIPVVVVSAYADEKKVRCYSQVKEVIHKPFDLDELHRKISRASSRVAA